MKKEDAYYSIEMLEEIDNDEDQKYFPLIAFFNAMIQKLDSEPFQNKNLNQIFNNENFKKYDNLTNTDSHLHLQSFSIDSNSSNDGDSLFARSSSYQNLENDTILDLKILVDLSEIYISGY